MYNFLRKYNTNTLVIVSIVCIGNGNCLVEYNINEQQ